MNFLINFFVFIFGLIIGSFLNCVIYRLEKEEKLTGRSYCPDCKHILEWQDLIPIFSFLFLRGRCRYCHKKISIQYPLVEILTGLIFLLIFNFQLSIFNQLSITSFINLIFLFYIASSLVIIFVYDLRYYIIPDKILLPTIIISFLYRFFENLFRWILIENWSLKIENFYPIFNYLLASLIAFAFFLFIFLISKGCWMGFGDCKLVILLSLLLGFPNILLAVFLSFFFGAIIGLGSIFINKKGLTLLEVKRSLGGSLKNKLLTGLKSQIPFAPFLITGTFVAMFWGQEIISWYLHFLIF